MTYVREDYDAYRDFVERIVDSAIAAARERHEDVGDPAALERYVAFDTTLIDEMIQTRIIEVTTPGFRGRTVRYGKRGWAR
jgi:hypothetical protein